MITAILDGNNLLYRIIKAKSYPELTSSEGLETGGIYGTIQSLHKIWNSIFPTYGILVFDGGLSDRRRALYPDYKKREETDEDAAAERRLFLQQKHYISEIMTHLGIPTIELPGREADDIIDFLAHWVMWRGGVQRVVIVSEDIDLCQIVERSNDQCEIELHRPIRDKIVTRHNAKETLGYPLEYYPWYKGLVGKPREVKGIEGVGEVTAVNLINAAHEKGITLKELIQGRLDEGSKKPMKRLQTIIDNWVEVERGRKLSIIKMEKFETIEQQAMWATAMAAYDPDRIRDQNIADVKEVLSKLDFLSILHMFDEWAQPFMAPYHSRKE